MYINLSVYNIISAHLSYIIIIIVMYIIYHLI